MKIIYGIIILFSITLSIGIGSGQENTGLEDSERFSISDGGSYTEASINSIRTFFCNNGFEEENLTKSLSIIAKPGETKEICIIQYNLANEDIYSWGAFPDNRIEIGGINGDRNCSDSHDRGNPFSKFIKQFPEDKVKIPANGYVIRKTTITFPIGMNGMQYGCFAYGEAQANGSEGELFSIVTRKVHKIEILVNGEGTIKSEITTNNILTEKNDDNKVYIKFDLTNNGSVEENIDAKINFYNSFGFKKEFSITGLSVSVGKTSTFNIKDFGGEIELPRYKGPFKINIEIQHKPYFQFDVSNAGIDPKILAGGKINKSKNIFIFPTIPLIGLLVFILLIYLAFFKKAKVVIIQQAPTTTNPPQQ